jgi:hypothetical protein
VWERDRVAGADGVPGGFVAHSCRECRSPIDHAFTAPSSVASRNPTRRCTFREEFHHHDHREGSEFLTFLYVARAVQSVILNPLKPSGYYMYHPL